MVRWDVSIVKPIEDDMEQEYRRESQNKMAKSWRQEYQLLSR